MALIHCPECSHEVSDRAPSCPHCGYIRSVVKSSTPSVREPEPTRIGIQEKHFVSGSIATICGIVLLVAGFLIAFVISPLGVVLTIVGTAVLYKGNTAVVGTHQVTCPYCGCSGKIETGARSYKCPACSKKSVLRDGYLFPVK